MYGYCTSAVPVVPCRKGVCYKQKISGGKSILKTAVIYARYSCDAQTEQSIEGQLHVCKEYAEKNDLLVVDEYIDRATTGTNDNRAAFQQMLADSKRRQWSVVIVYKLDRFARNMYESVINRKKLSDNGVCLVSAMENIPDTPEGKLFQAVIEGFNEYYSEDLRQKVNRGLRESWIKGNATGGIPPFGYVIKDKKYVIDETEADAVREIFRKYSQGFKANSIANDLKERNVRRKNGKLVDQKYVYVILHDKRYTGVVTHKGEEYYNIFPPIITKEVWSQVNAINEENNPKLTTLPNLGGPPLLFASPDAKSQEDFVDEQISALNKAGISDVVVITCKTLSSSKLTNCFTGSNDAKRWKGRKIPVHTVRKFKGMEAGAVILIDVDQTLWEPPLTSYQPEPGTLFYTAASRAKHELRIVCDMDVDACSRTLALMDEKAGRHPDKKLANVLGASLVR